MTMIACNPLNEYMLDFLRAYLTFAAGATSIDTATGEHNPFNFTTRFGLCSAIAEYAMATEHPVLQTEDFYRSLDYMLFRRMVEDAGMNFVGTDSVFPFGYEDYRIRLQNFTQHKCPNRLGFIRMFIQELEIECAN